MTDKVMDELKACEDDRKMIADDLEAFKDRYAKYIASCGGDIRDGISHPSVPEKRDIRKNKRSEFMNKLKKVLGL